MKEKEKENFSTFISYEQPKLLNSNCSFPSLGSQDQMMKCNIFPPYPKGEKDGKNQSSGFFIKNRNIFSFNINNIILNNNDLFEEKKNEEKKEKTKENKNEEIFNNIRINNNISSAEKFFNGYSYNLECSCFKNQCNNYLCDCRRLGQYCFNCKCINCINKPPKDLIFDKKEINYDELNFKKKKIICTCTKSGCKNKYCECLKNDLECNDLCRCINCANTKNPKNINPYIKRLKTCLTNTIKIVNNKISFDDRKIYNKKLLKKKRKKNKNDKEEKENEIINEELFDENGKIIFTHVKLSDIEQKN